MSSYPVVTHSGSGDPAALWAPMRILIADDHVAVREGVRAILESEDQFVVCCEAANGADAVQLALESVPDVAILDISMPGMNGIEAARHIAENRPDIPVLLLSMHEEFTTQLNALKKLGIKGFVPKSKSSDELIRAVKAVAGGHTFFPTIHCERR
jgi:DNA-binding NarL/FixJ family response regulator